MRPSPSRHVFGAAFVLHTPLRLRCLTTQTTATRVSSFTPTISRSHRRRVSLSPRASIADASSTSSTSYSTSTTPATSSPTSPSVIRTLRFILAGVNQLSRPLYNGKRRAVAIGWTVATIFLAFLATMYTVMLSMVQKFFWNTLSTRDVAKFGKLLAVYALAVTLGPMVLSTFEWVKERFALMWRRALSEHLMRRYFVDNNYYKLSLSDDVDNPDQRMSEDVMKFTDRAVRFLTIIGVGVFDLLVFSVILYRVYSPLLYTLIVYAGIGTAIIAITGRNLVRLNQQQVTREANFRFGLVRVRESTESVAFYGGEQAEKKELFDRLSNLFNNKIALLGLKRLVTYFSTSFRYWAQIVPMAVIAPQYFAGKVPLGTISQVFFSFNHVLSSLGLIANEFTALTEFSAGVGRLKGIADALEHEDELDTSAGERIESKVDVASDANAVSASGLSVLTPGQPPRLLVNSLDFDVRNGQRLLVIGRSGIGKSSLMRAISGLWESGYGTVERPAREHTLFLPQRPFIMLGTLRENVIYPSQRANISDEEVTSALKEVNLGFLLDSEDGLDSSGEVLSRQLSLGEQQRLAFARVKLSRPRVVILDESTSALDLENERDMYNVIARMGVTCISVGNRPSLLDFHDRILRLGKDGEWSLERPDDVRKRQSEQALNI